MYVHVKQLYMHLYMYMYIYIRIYTHIFTVRAPHNDNPTFSKGSFCI